MSADKRALDELDALFGAVPAKAVSASRPAKKPRSGEARVEPVSGIRDREPHATKRDNNGSGNNNVVTATESQQEDRAMYTHLPAALLPKRFRGSRGGGGGGGAPYTPRGNTSSSNVMGMAAIRLANLVRKMLGGVTEGRAAGAAIHSKLERKVIHLDAPTSWQTEAQTAGARACPGRAAGNAVRRGLSGKRCKKVGLNALETRGGGSLSFRDLLGLHGVWKDYAARVVSLCGENRKLLQQRILSADLQGCYLTVYRASASSLVNVAGIVIRETCKTFQLVTPQGKTKTIPKRTCAVRLAFGGRVVDLNGKALEGRLAGGRAGAGAGKGQPVGRERSSAAAGVGPDDSPADLPLPTAAL